MRRALELRGKCDFYEKRCCHQMSSLTLKRPIIHQQSILLFTMAYTSIQMPVFWVRKWQCWTILSLGMKVYGVAYICIYIYICCIKLYSVVKSAYGCNRKYSGVYIWCGGCVDERCVWSIGWMCRSVGCKYNIVYVSMELFYICTEKTCRHKPNGCHVAYGVH